MLPFDKNHGIYDHGLYHTDIILKNRSLKMDLVFFWLNAAKEFSPLLKVIFWCWLQSRYSVMKPWHRVFRKGFKMLHLFIGKSFFSNRKPFLSPILKIYIKLHRTSYSSLETDVQWSGTFKMTSTSEVNTEHLSVWSDLFTVW